jgi:hypothetical protein
MPAIIRVETGISAGMKYWIDRPVLRIGSDPQCEICLPSADLAPHALTLEFRDGRYRAYNRCAGPISVGRAAVQPGTSGAWQGDHTIQLPGDLRLVLEIDGDPRPSARPETRMDDEFGSEDAAPHMQEAGAPVETAKKKSSNTMVQLGVIGACILGMAAMLTMRGSEGSNAAADRPSFEAIVRSTLDEKNDDDVSRALLPRLQYAQAALVRGHGQLARRQFLRLRDQLIRQHEALPSDRRGGVQRMLQYVEYQLGRRS